MKALYFLLFGALFFALPSCAQTKNMVVKKYAYFMVNVPGNLPVEEDGSPRAFSFDTSRIVYLEIATSNFKLEKVWKNGVAYDFRVNLLKQMAHVAGYEKSTMKPVVIKVAKGNQLLQIIVGLPVKHAEASKSIPAGLLLLEGRTAGKTVAVIIKEAQELGRPEQVQ